MIKEEKPSELQIQILETILENSIESISYQNPEIELRDVVKGKSLEEIRKVLRNLSNQRALEYLPKRFLLFDKSLYVVDMARARDLSDSYKEA